MFPAVQTPELCIAAVEQNGLALQYVETQTPEICLAAVSQNKEALQYVKPEFKYLFEDKTQSSYVCTSYLGELLLTTGIATGVVGIGMILAVYLRS